MAEQGTPVVPPDAAPAQQRGLNLVHAFFADDLDHAVNVPITPELTELVNELVEPEASVRAVYLVDAAIDKDIRDLGHDGNVVDMAVTGRLLTFRADPGPGTKSLAFFWDGKPTSEESTAPYAAFGDAGGNLTPGPMLQGEHVLRIVPYPEMGGQGKAGPAWEGIVTIRETPIVIEPSPSGMDYLIRKTDDLSDTWAKVKSGTPQRTVTVGLEAGATWTDQLFLNRSYVSLVPFGKGARPRLTHVNGPLAFGSGIRDVTVRGIDLVGKGSGATADGARGIVKRVENLTFEDVLFQNTKGGLSSHVLESNAAKEDDFNRGLKIRRCRLVDFWGTGLKEGHAFYIGNWMGVELDENYVEGAAYHKLDAQGKTILRPYAHGGYLQVRTYNVRLTGNVLWKAESYGFQARGADLAPHATDEDPAGIVMSDNWIDRASIGLMLSGLRGTALRNVIRAVQFHNHGWTHGQGGIDYHCRSGELDGNLRIGGGVGEGTPDPTTSNKKTSRMGHVNVSYRAKVLDGWEYTKASGPLNPRIGSNPDRIDVNLAEPVDIYQDIRSGKISVREGRGLLVERASKAVADAKK